MRELILLRHAHADSPAGVADPARPLSPTGRAEARDAGAWLRDHGLRPDRILCSPAQRTRETLAVLGEGFDGVETRIEDAIYGATPGTLAALVDAHADAPVLLLVGHNPGLEELAALMASGQSGDHRGMPPGGVVVLEFPRDVPVEPGVATMRAFWWP